MRGVGRPGPARLGTDDLDLALALMPLRALPAGAGPAPLPRGPDLPVLLWAGFARAQAQGPTLTSAIDAQQYKPGPGAYDVLNVLDPRVPHHHDWRVAVSGNLPFRAL